MEWATFSPDKIRSGKDAKGERYLQLFAVDFKSKMGYDLEIGCVKCFRNELQKFLNKKEIMSVKSDYILKAKYSGVILAPGSDKRLFAGQFTDAEAKVFLNEHPKGAGLFEKVPTKKTTPKKIVASTEASPTPPKKRGRKPKKQ